jgi:hypothetical protein
LACTALGAFFLWEILDRAENQYLMDGFGLFLGIVDSRGILIQRLDFPDAKNHCRRFAESKSGKFPDSLRSKPSPPDILFTTPGRWFFPDCRREEGNPQMENRPNAGCRKTHSGRG